MDESLTDVPTMGEGSGPEELKPGDRLGEYRVIRPLGRGGMGQVYEVEHTTLQRRYALKLLPSEFSSRPGFLERFRREARVMANLDHPNIVRVDDFAHLEGHYVLRLELIHGVRPQPEEAERPADAAEPPTDLDAAATDSDGGPEAVPPRAVSLSDLATHFSGRLEQDLLGDLLDQILDALAYAHGLGAIHRDLKPGNILLEEAEDPGIPARSSAVPLIRSIRARVADFGLVRLVGEDWLRSRAQQSVSGSTSLSDAGTRGGPGDEATGDSTRSLLGTYEYMSPEQKQGSDVDARSDLYAVGLMTCRLLTGRSDTGLQLPSELVPDIRKGWDDFVRKALHPDPPGRFQSAQEMREALHGVFAEVEADEAKEPEPAPAEETPPPKEPALKEKSVPEPKSKRSSAGVWIAVVGALALAVVIGLVAALATSPKGPTAAGLDRPESPLVPPPTPAGDEDADEEAVEQAQKLASEGQPRTALETLDAFLRKRPGSPFAERAKALKRRVEGDLQAKTNADGAGLAIRRAREQEKAGRLDDAMVTLVQALGDAPEDRKLKDEVSRLRRVVQQDQAERSRRAALSRKAAEAEAEAERQRLAAEKLRLARLAEKRRAESDAKRREQLAKLRLAQRPSASITTCGASVVSIKGAPWVVIKAVVQASHLKDQTITLQARFFFTKGASLRDMDRLYRSTTGEVQVEGAATPHYDSTRFKDWTLRIPVSQLHVTGRAQVYARLSAVHRGLTLATRNTPAFTVAGSTRTPPPPKGQGATINRVWVTHNHRVGREQGLIVHVSVTVKGCQGRPVSVTTWFWRSRGVALRDFDRRNASSTGQVSASVTVTPKYASATFTDVVVFMPYSQLHLAAGRHTLGVKAGAFCGGKQIGLGRAPTEFSVTQPGRLAPIRKGLKKR